MKLKEFIAKLQGLESKYSQYQDVEVVLAVHTTHEFNPEVEIDYIDEVTQKIHDSPVCRIVLVGEMD